MCHFSYHCRSREIRGACAKQYSRQFAHMSDPRSLLTHKLVLLGDTAVGKSCLAVRFVREEFLEYQEPTIGGTCQ